MEPETRKLNISLMGKDGETATFTIQRHRPTVPMILIRVNNGFSIFCQENHPLIYNGDKVSAASELVWGDTVWVDSTIVGNKNSVKPPLAPKAAATAIFELNEYSTIDFNGKEMIRGKHPTSLRLEPNFINYSIPWIRQFLDYFVERSEIKLRSYDLLQQIKFMCDRCGYYFDFEIYKFAEKLYFIPRIEKSDSTITRTFKGPFEIIDRVSNLPWDGYVYDIKTETEEFMIGGMQTHNSFHTGGMATVETPNLMRFLMDYLDDNLADHITSIFKQDDLDLLSIEDGISLVIDRNIYIGNYAITEAEDHIILPAGAFSFYHNDLEIPVNIEKEIKVWTDTATSKTETPEGIITLTYGKGKKILSVEASITHPKMIARKLDQYIGGKSPWRTPEDLYLKFFNILSPLGNWDSCHLETIIANILRWRKNPQIPARMKYPYDAVTYGIKDLPGIISWPMGIAFENMTKSLTNGLISERASESSIEKILFGTPLSDVGKKKR